MDILKINDIEYDMSSLNDVEFINILGHWDGTNCITIFKK